MTLFSVKQSLPLSVLFAFLSGLFLTLATASTYIPAHIDIVASRWLEEEGKEKKKEQENDGNDANKNNNNNKNEESFIDNIIMEESQQQDDDEEHQTRTKAAPPRRHPKKVSKRMWKIAYITNLLLAALAGILNLVGTWFGPISLFVPLKQISQILSGMVLFSYILRTEPKPNKETSVGNYIIVLSSLMLIFVGPEVKEDPDDAKILLSQFKAQMLGGGLLVIGFVFCFPYQFLLGCTNVSTTNRFHYFALLITEVVHAVIGNNCSKLFHLLSGTYFIVNTVIFVLAIFTVTYSGVLRSTIIMSQTDYIPLTVSANIFLNGIVGLVIWDDHIISIGGYTVLYFFFLMGVYLISDYEILPGTFFKDHSNSDDNQHSSLIYNLLYGNTRNKNIHSKQHSTAKKLHGQLEEDCTRTAREESDLHDSLRSEPSFQQHSCHDNK